MLEETLATAIVLHRARDDQRGTGFVDEYRIDFIDYHVVVVGLNLIVLRGGHTVIPQVVEAELCCGSIGNIAAIGSTALSGRHLVLNNANVEAQKLIEAAHPLSVTACEVVVDGDKLAITSGKGVEVEG